MSRTTAADFNERADLLARRDAAVRELERVTERFDLHPTAQRFPLGDDLDMNGGGPAMRTPSPLD